MGDAFTLLLFLGSCLYMNLSLMVCISKCVLAEEQRLSHHIFFQKLLG